MIEHNRIITIDEIVTRLKANYAQTFGEPLDKEECGLLFMEHFCFPIVNAVPEGDNNTYFRLINIEQAYDIIDRMNLEVTKEEIKKEVDAYAEKQGLDTALDLYITMVYV